MTAIKTNNRGFTLVELMVAMAISIVVLLVIFQIYQSHQKAASTQRMIIEMQQNARTALTLMKREIRMAGYKPAASDGIDNDGLNGMDDADRNENGRKLGAEIGVVTAFKNMIMFRMDILPDDPSECSNGTDDGGVPGVVDDAAECYDGLADDPNEEIRYQLQPNAAGDGNDLVRIANGGAPEILAYDIEAIAFGYAFDDDEDGALDTDTGNPDGNIIWAYASGAFDLDKDAQTGAAIASPVKVIKIAFPEGTPTIGAVRIWLLARTPAPIPGEADTRTYQVGDQIIGPGTYNPAYRRTLQTATVYCRNLRF